MILIPSILDFIFVYSTAARYSRVLIFLIILASLLTNHKLFLRSKIVGIDTIFCTIALYAVGTVSEISFGGAITPNIASLLLIMFIVSANIDLYETALKTLALSIHILVALSVFVILLRINPRGYYAGAEGYPVLFDFIGIPGRNIGVFSHPNVLGQAATLSLLFIVTSKTNKLYLMLPIFCIIKCGSRTSIIGILAGLCVYGTILLFKKRQSKGKSTYIEAPVVIGVFILGILLASSFQFLQIIGFLDPSDLVARVGIWQNALAIFQSSSTIGLGWNWESRAVASQLINVWAVTAHNSLLDMMFSAGIIGMLIFLVLLSKIIAYFNRLETSEKVVLTSILISGISEAYIDIQYPSVQTYLFLLFALGVNRERSIKSE
jgi:hypothetical protein